MILFCFVFQERTDKRAETMSKEKNRSCRGSNLQKEVQLYNIQTYFTNETNMKSRNMKASNQRGYVLQPPSRPHLVIQYLIFIFNIGAPLFTKFHLFVTSGVILIWYSQKKVNVKQKVLWFHWPARHRRHTKQWPFTPNVSGKTLQYSSLFTNYRQHTYRWIFSQRVQFLIVVFGWDLELKTSESQHENMSH